MLILKPKEPVGSKIQMMEKRSTGLLENGKIKRDGWMDAFSDWFTVRDQRKCKRTDFVNGEAKRASVFRSNAAHRYRAQPSKASRASQ